MYVKHTFSFLELLQGKGGGAKVPNSMFYILLGFGIISGQGRGCGLHIICLAKLIIFVYSFNIRYIITMTHIEDASLRTHYWEYLIQKHILDTLLRISYSEAHFGHTIENILFRSTFWTLYWEYLIQKHILDTLLGISYLEAHFGHTIGNILFRSTFWTHYWEYLIKKHILDTLLGISYLEAHFGHTKLCIHTSQLYIIRSQDQYFILLNSKF